MFASLLGDEREPEPGAGSLRGCVEPPERLEDALAVGLWDAVAVVVDGQHVRGRGAERDPDGPVLAPVVGGVDDEVRDEQPQAGLPAAHQRRRVGYVQLERRRRDTGSRTLATASVTMSARSTSSWSGLVASPRASACSPSSSTTRRRCSSSASSSIVVALLGRDVGMPVQRRQRGLDGRQRSAQLVAGVEGEAPRRLQRSLAQRRGGAQPLQHRVEGRSHPSHLGRPLGLRHPDAEVLLGRDPPRGRSAAGATAATCPPRPGRSPARPRAARRARAMQAACRARLTTLELGQRGDDLKLGQVAEAGADERRHQHPIALPVARHGPQPCGRDAAGRRRAPRFQHHGVGDEQLQRAARGAEHRVQSPVGVRQRVLDGVDGGRARQLGRARSRSSTASRAVRSA